MTDQPDAHPRVSPRPRIVVVDADRRVRDGIDGLLGCDDRVELAGSAAHVEAALALCGATDPDAVIIDPRLPEATDGLALIERLRSARPGLRFLVLAWSSAVERALGGDAAVAVVSASAGTDDLVALVLDVLAVPAGPSEADASIRECA